MLILKPACVTQIKTTMTDLTRDLIHQNIHQRQSVGLLVEPAPHANQLQMAFEAALSAPDHHRLKPTRFVVVAQKQREAFGHLLAQALADLGDADPIQLQRVKQHPFRAPMLILALTQIQQHAKVPAFEQILSTGAAVQNLLLSLQAQGFSTMWRSGAVIESDLLKQSLGLSSTDLISGIIYVGTAAKAMAPRAPTDLNVYVTTWQG